jgi:hypothetical protein
MVAGANEGMGEVMVDRKGQPVGYMLS